MGLRFRDRQGAEFGVALLDLGFVRCVTWLRPGQRGGECCGSNGGGDEVTALWRQRAGCGVVHLQASDYGFVEAAQDAVVGAPPHRPSAGHLGFNCCDAAATVARS
ncbi:MAG TPA: hypothetical protein VK570_13240, partial [Rubrivivax sp.]|nr:hypothetical protein [Rubrivivax sp.]